MNWVRALLEKKGFIALIALFLLAVFAFTLLHYHEDGNHSHDCALCRLVQSIFCLFALAFAALIGLGLKNTRFFSSGPKGLVARFNALTLLNKAPPFLS